MRRLLDTNVWIHAHLQSGQDQLSFPGKLHIKRVPWSRQWQDH